MQFDSKKATFDVGNFWCACWLSLNIGTTLLNKSIFKFFHFPYPIFLSLIHMLFTSFFSWISIQFFGYPTKKLDLRQHVKVGLFSFLFCINIVFGNVSIKYTSVAMGQVIKASIPAFTMVLSMIFLHKRYTLYHLYSVLLVIFGVATATYGDMEFAWIGLIITLIGCVLSSLKTITTSSFLGDLSFHPIDLIFRMSTYAIPQMLLMSYYVGEIDQMQFTSIEYDHIYDSQSSEVELMVPGIFQDSSLLWALAINGFLAFLLNFSNFMFTKHTSALTVTIFGCVKNVLTIVISVIIFNTPVTFLNSVGTIVTIAGAVYYSSIEYKAKTRTLNKNLTREGTPPISSTAQSPIGNIDPHSPSFARTSST